MDDGVTYIVPTSPVRTNPRMEHIVSALESILRVSPDSRVIVVADGVRAEQEHYREAYEEYLDALGSVLISGMELLRSSGWQHQANVFARGLEFVDTPVVAYVEHDTEIIGDVDVGGISRVIRDGHAHVVRLAAFDEVPDYWEEHFESPSLKDGVRMMRTTQYSTWPHYLGYEFAHRMMRKYFAPDCRTMIEPVMHAVLANAGWDGWDKWRVWTYAPEGGMRRCVHKCEVRGDDPVYDFKYVYPGGVTPEGAPAPWTA